MSRRTGIPAYRLHRQSGQAIVTLTDGTGGRKDVLLGKYDSPESRAEYLRVLAEWQSAGRTLPRPTACNALSVHELLDAYWTWAEKTYRDSDGTPTRELENLKDALRPLRKLYGSTDAAKFGPMALRTVREDMIAAGLCRRTINTRVGRLKRVFRWAVSYEVLPAVVYEALRAVPGLQRGRGEARDTEPIKPVPEADVRATLPFLPAGVAAIVEVQLLAGCRVSEVLTMRGCDLDVTGSTWIYRPAKHKNRNRGIDRVIFLGPLSQTIIKRFLKTDLQAYLFAPADALAARDARKAAARKTKRTPSQLARTRKAKPKWRPRDRYCRNSYRQAIDRACANAGVKKWSPLQLRHTAATLIRARYGVEAAKAILGHTRVETTQIYAEQNLGKAEEIMREIG
jgi:integrase